MDRPKIEIQPLNEHGSLSGFVLAGRWPDDTEEWTMVLLMAVRMAAVPGMLDVSTVFRVAEPASGLPAHGIGTVMAEGHLMGQHALRPGQFAEPLPPGLAILHPPSANPHADAGHVRAAGCLLLPGLPHLGLDHRAAWVEADAHGNISRLVAAHDIDPWTDADTAALSTLLAA